MNDDVDDNGAGGNNNDSNITIPLMQHLDQ